MKLRRTQIMAGNWKMHFTAVHAAGVARELLEELGPWAATLPRVEVVLAPPFTSLSVAAEAVAGSPIRLAAQDMHWAAEGAFTGAVSPAMIAEFAPRVIIGHSERRGLFGETDDDVHRKVHAAYDHGLEPIVCVGETEEQRDAGRTDGVVIGQIGAATAGLAHAEAGRLVIAYEPVWAIGTGRACAPQEADRVARLIRTSLADSFGGDAAARARILYGGSVNPGNGSAYLAEADVDGALVGGASLKAADFAALVRLAEGPPVG